MIHPRRRTTSQNRTVHEQHLTQRTRSDTSLCYIGHRTALKYNGKDSEYLSVISWILRDGIGIEHMCVVVHIHIIRDNSLWNICSLLRCFLYLYLNLNISSISSTKSFNSIDFQNVGYSQAVKDQNYYVMSSIGFVLLLRTPALSPEPFLHLTNISI